MEELDSPACSLSIPVVLPWSAALGKLAAAVLLAGARARGRCETRGRQSDEDEEEEERKREKMR